MAEAAGKRQLRRELLARRRAVPQAQAAAVARAVTLHVLGSPEFQAAVRVVLYAALADELPTCPLLNGALARGKRLLLPRMLPGRRLEFAPAEGFGDLRPGPHGVLEPPPEVPAESLESGDLALVPGVAFDRRGHRLGRGQGFYDRTFPAGAAFSPVLFGLAYAFQVVEAVPHGPRDRRMDAVVTELGIDRMGEAPAWE